MRTGHPMFAVLFVSILGYVSMQVVNAELPPAPPQPELVTEYREQLIGQLNEDSYQQREFAQQILTRGGLETVGVFPEFAQEMTLEAKVRLARIFRQIMLRMIREQSDELLNDLFRIQQQIRLTDEAIFGPRFDEFQAIHRQLTINASIRYLSRLNARAELNRGTEGARDLSTTTLVHDFCARVYLGEDFLGQQDDLWHITHVLNPSESTEGWRGIYHIGDCPIPLENLETLAAGMSRVLVSHRGVARLGISPSNTSSLTYPQNGNWQISSVQNFTAAKYAGLESNDTIVRINGKLVGDFDSFTKDLEAFALTDTIVLDVIRHNAPKKIVTLQLNEQGETGIELDTDFPRFPLIKSVRETSSAAEAKFSNQYAIVAIDDYVVNTPNEYLYRMKSKVGEETVELTVREIEPVKVQLRGWLGPYR